MFYFIFNCFVVIAVGYTQRRDYNPFDKQSIIDNELDSNRYQLFCDTTPIFVSDDHSRVVPFTVTCYFFDQEKNLRKVDFRDNIFYYSNSRLDSVQVRVIGETVKYFTIRYNQEENLMSVAKIRSLVANDPKVKFRFDLLIESRGFWDKFSIIPN